MTLIDATGAAASVTMREPGALRRLVVLGASAGGLDALTRVFDHLPSVTGASFVVIQHLSSEHPTMMDTLLARHTHMRVSIAQQDDRLMADRVLLIPPGKHMCLLDDHIELFDRPLHGVGLPIDEFLSSAARTCGERLVAVILSGTGSDGSRGVVQVSEWGGLVLAQAPETCEFDGMPQSALATGVVDRCLPPEGIGETLGKLLGTELAASGDRGGFDGGANLERAEDLVQTLSSIASAVRQYAGLDLDQYKSDMVLRRIRRRMQLLGETSLLNYADRLVGNEAEAHHLRREVLIPVTRFFRDPETFVHLADKVLPAMLAQHPLDQPFRVWVAACATGEEAYSLAMLISEVCASLQRWPMVKIYATDIEQRFLDVASAGAYPESIVGELSPERLARFFTYANHQHTVKAELRAQVVFARHNILVDPPFTRLNLVACRNLLIYFRQHTQEAVLRRLQFALQPDGVLVLGRSESLLNVEGDFAVSDSRGRVFRLAQAVKPRLPLAGGTPPESRWRVPAQPRVDSQQQMLAAALSQHLVRHYAPPALLIDEHRQVLHMSGGLQTWLCLREGPPSLDLADLLPLELSSVVMHLLEQLPDEGRVCTPLLTFEGRRVVVSAARLSGAWQARRVVAIAFESPDTLSASEPALTIALADPAREQVAHLERELVSTRANLQTSIEELQLTNEELQASNEELMASNEELQSTNEELQSVNEELYSVNAEYQTKVHMLGALNADLEGMSRALGIPHLFIDERLGLIRAAETAGLFNIRESDVGRCIEDFSHRLVYPELYADLRRVVASGVSVQREVRSEDGRWHLAHLVPYTTTSPTMQPVRRAVATFVDTTVVHDATRLQAIIDAMPANLAVLDRQGAIVSVNQRWCAFAQDNGDPSLTQTGTGQNYVTILAASAVSEPAGPERDRIVEAQLGLQAVLRGESPEFFQVYPCHSPTEQRWFAMHVTPLQLSEGGALVTHYNVSGWVQPEEEEGA